jgi:hypothetical protein
MQGFGNIYDQLGNKFVDENLHLHLTFELQELKDVVAKGPYWKNLFHGHGND